MDRTEFFNEVEKRVKSARSNYEHGRSHQGQKILVGLHGFIADFLGDNL